MKCADPVLCYIPSKGTKVYRHFSLATPIIKRAHQKVFDCGQCPHCRKKRAYELACKCVLHSSLYQQNCFLTLTYDETKETYHNDFNYPDIQKFKKRLQKHCRYHEKKTIQIFNVHEYGKNGKKHWHLVVFGHDFSTDPKSNYSKELHTVRNGNPLYTHPRLTRLWPHGFSTIGDVSEASAMYTAQYAQKDLKNGNLRNNKKAHSIHKGIGQPYFLLHYKQILSLGYLPVNGRKLPIPRSFQRLAHKHYCHYYEPSAFHDTRDRKSLYRPFKPGLANLEIAHLFLEYKATRKEFIKQLEEEWNQTIQEHLTTGKIPDFIKSNSNYEHDLKRKNSGENF